MRRYATLRRSREFAWLRRRGARSAARFFTLYRSGGTAPDGRAAAGIVVSKDVGKSVVRNAVKRRLGSALHEALAGRSPERLLIVARPASAQASFQELRVELFTAIG